MVPAAFLLLVLVAQLGFSVRRQSQTIDEADHIYAGYRYWQCSDFGVNPEHPPFAKLVDTLPLVFDRPKNPGVPCASYSTGQAADFLHGHDFLYSNDAGKILAETPFLCSVVYCTPGSVRLCCLAEDVRRGRSAPRADAARI